MFLFQTLVEYLRQIETRNAAYGDQPQPPAPPEQLATLAIQSNENFQYKLPNHYLKILEVSDGVDFNGYKLYASKTRYIIKYDCYIEGFLEANGLWEEYEENTDHHLIMFGETGDDLYLFDKRNQKFKITDKVGGDAYEEFETFEELIERFFRNALGMFEDEEDESATV